MFLDAQIKVLQWPTLSVLDYQYSRLSIHIQVIFEKSDIRTPLTQTIQPFAFLQAYAPIGVHRSLHKGGQSSLSSQYQGTLWYKNCGLLPHVY